MAPINLTVKEATLREITRELSPTGGVVIRVGYLMGYIDDQDYVVEGVHVPEQDSDLAQATVSNADERKALEAIAALDKNVLGMVTYHGPHPTFESAATRQTKEKLSEKGIPAVVLVVNRLGDSQVYQ